jgi:integrase
MRHKTIKYVKRVKARGKYYYYFDTGAEKDGKPVLKSLPDPSSREFGKAYATLLGHRTRRESVGEIMSVRKLAALYEKSPPFKKNAKSTQKTYSTYLRVIEHEIGNAPASKVIPKDTTAMMDKMAETPGAANLVLSVMGAMYKWGRSRFHVPSTVDPTRDIEKFETGEHLPWPEPILNAALASDNARVRLATHLLYYTAQRIGDTVKFRWSDIRDGVLHMEQQKTDKPLKIPLHSSLIAELERTPKRAMTILTTVDGHSIGPQRIRIALKEHCASFGQDLVPHGLRKNAVIALLEAGCSIAETASISGQSFQMVEYYAKLRDQGRLASAAVLKWEANKK